MKENILETLGSPLVELESPEGATVAAKVESFNPGGSAKDRPATYMIEAAEDAGELGPGDRIVEPTSGNTGIGISMAAAAKGYDVTIVMSEEKSIERQQIMRAYGADLHLIEGDMTRAREVADRLEREEGMVQLRQFENEANPQAHYETTGPEILEQVGDRTIDAFVAGIGTGGTITGTGRRLREAFPGVTIVGVEPEGNAVLATGEAGSDDFQGMGPGFVSEILDVELIDELETVTIEDAEAECRRLAREEGILVGQSSGAMGVVARDVAERLADPGDSEDPPLVATVFWDSGERYMSTGMFDEQA
ncbi:PLP-dependent cysteine synthase family protein [Halapricum hydrolyticum]|uniref:PLP-dependent cysteine synthase family protein n=1 Tax=Halapricum hydrolyticum TaxID=2979991 RepID=A0AAE3IB40_9EURY|nr:PLP-dependent cysteine synthase family protein [Halapricum hydrolyticum]MCU4717609.1 PLP-dependent cysteine synthase family protein [Halapricum hydrolyticum]MCU4726862.1 PLP-dependent cysteine synthase family protein [Halapricum hydrolyticum]